MNQIIPIIVTGVQWLLANYQALIAGVMAVLMGLIAICMLIPGAEPEATLQKIVDILAKYSVKKDPPQS